MKTGQVFKIHSDFYYVKFEDKIFECKIREILKKQQQKVFVGDFVEFENNFINNLLPRKNYLLRPSVSNVDQVVIVSAVKEPDLNFEQLDRYISFAKYHGFDIKLCFNKNDLSEDDSIIETVFKIYEPLGFDILFTSALEKIGINEFKEVLQEKTTVFCGSSGVGKSSLINAISPNLNLKTKPISEKSEKGVHTTRHCEILSINNNIKIVDTPGFSNLKFDFILPTQIETFFDEIYQYSKNCKFKDCLHINETGCAVLENIDDINMSRYNSYLNFVEEAKQYKEKIKYSGTKKETFTKNLNNKTTTKISSKKRQISRKVTKQNITKEENNE